MGIGEPEGQAGVWARGGVRELRKHRMDNALRQRVGRSMIRWAIGRFLHWQPLDRPEPGFSIILGVPWGIRHLLPVNLTFIARTDCSELRKVFVVFDRTHRSGAEALIEKARRDHPQVPLEFLFHDAVPGWIGEKANVSTLYNSLNTTHAMRECTTRYAIMHDFDLYPLVPNYFTEVVRAMRERELCFSGLELTHFDGLTDQDKLIGTWCLGVDVQWLRKTYRPVDCFHRVAKVNGRWINLDPYSWIQSQTRQRDLAGTIDGNSCCHVQNLCSTYLRFTTGRPAKIVWRLHYLWYLESLCGIRHNFEMAMEAMEGAGSPIIKVDGREIDFSTAHVTCANVLRTELGEVERALFGACRPEVARYIDTFEAFLGRVGDNSCLASVAA